MMNMPLPRKSLAEAVADQLQAAIAKGTYAVGEKLPTEPELMEQFGVGRSSVREAVRLLTNSGWVRAQQGVGTFVASQSGAGRPLVKILEEASFTELDELRLMLEIKIVEKAAINRTSRDISRMQQQLKKRWQYAQKNNLDACVQADIAFHTTLAEASRSGIMLDLYKTIADYLRLEFLHKYNDTQEFLATQERHEELLQAIAEQRAEDAITIATLINKFR
ncbi:FadR family transcriptional regulator [Nostoc ellipsosporum NOK]|nr:FadR family transcriptional regulator [Nostoc ellipsosporum NOK]